MVIAVSDDWYGPSTKRMREIVTRISRIRWFCRAPDDGARASAEALVSRHCELLRLINREASLLTAQNISIVSGPMRALYEGRWSLDLYEPWGQRWNDVAGVAGGRAVQTLRVAVESNIEARNLLRPPLWPFIGQSNILGGAFVADVARRKQLSRLFPHERDCDLACALLSNVDSRVWHALLWELALGSHVVDIGNPFEPLIELYELGFFPVGVTGNCYDLYVPTLTDAQATGLAAPLGKRGEDYLSWTGSS